MSGIELIAAALAAGALAGATGVAGDAVRDAYAALRGLLRTRLTGRPGAQQALDLPEESAGQWVASIGDDLAEVGADQDQVVLAAARTLLDTAARSNGYRQVNICNSNVSSVGDYNTVNVTADGSRVTEP